MKRVNTALTLSVKGFKVFPCTPNSKIPLKGWTDWEARATDDPNEITRIWNDTPHANIGLATGPSGLVVIDFDAAKSPQEQSGIENWRSAFPQRKLPATFTVRTGSGGWHVYYRPSNGVALRNSASRLVDRVDTRAQGGYVLAPGSVVDGNPYVITNDQAIAELPDWIVQELADKPASRRDVQPKGNSSAYALAALRNECTRIRETGEGGRNHAVNRAAWNVSRFVARGELDDNLATDHLIDAGLSCGLEYVETMNAVSSGMNRGLEKYGTS